MSFLTKLNKKRLWALLTAVWVAAVTLYYWDDVVRRYNASIVKKSELDRSAQESRFFDCLNRNSENWFSLKEKHEKECETATREECKGSMWCADTYLTDLCIKGKSEQCRNIYFVSVEQLKDIDPSATRRKEAYEHIEFYLSTDFSAPLKTALLLVFSVPLGLALLPSVSRRLWKWLTS